MMWQMRASLPRRRRISSALGNGVSVSLYSTWYSSGIIARACSGKTFEIKMLFCIRRPPILLLDSGPGRGNISTRSERVLIHTQVRSAAMAKAATATAATQGGKGSMKVRPLHDRLLVKREDESEEKIGGIIIPDTAKEKPQRGKVVAVGNGKVTEEDRKSTRLNSSPRLHLVCRLLLEKKKKNNKR